MQTPTQYFYIDIDHPKMPAKEIWNQIILNMQSIFDKEIDGSTPHDLDVRKYYGVRLVHETPSGGLRIVILATQQFTSVEEHIKWFAEKFYLSSFGDVDYVVHDLAHELPGGMSDSLTYSLAPYGGKLNPGKYRIACCDIGNKKNVYYAYFNVTDNGRFTWEDVEPTGR